MASGAANDRHQSYFGIPDYILRRSHPTGPNAAVGTGGHLEEQSVRVNRELAAQSRGHGRSDRGGEAGGGCLTGQTVGHPPKQPGSPLGSTHHRRHSSVPRGMVGETSRGAELSCDPASDGPRQFRPILMANGQEDYRGVPTLPPRAGFDGAPSCRLPRLAGGPFEDEAKNGAAPRPRPDGRRHSDGR